MLVLMRVTILSQLHNRHHNENGIMGLQTPSPRAYLEGWHTCALVNSARL